MINLTGIPLDMKLVEKHVEEIAPVVVAKAGLDLEGLEVISKSVGNDLWTLRLRAQRIMKVPSSVPFRSSLQQKD